MPDLEAESRIRADVSRETFDDLQTYVDLLKHWQTRINLIGPTTVEQIWERHIADSLQIAPRLEGFLPASRPVLADMGAGAGLPGIPLALHLRANHAVFVHLIDSNIKKAAFLREALRVLRLDGAVHHLRLESMSQADLAPQPQVVLARALAPLQRLAGFAAPWIENGATGAFLKGGHVDKELAETAQDDRLRYKVVNLDPATGNSLVIVRKMGNEG